MLTQPLKIHGGKHYLVKRIIALMPPHLHYVEPYFGGGSVLLARDLNRDWFIDEQWKLQNGEKVPAHLRGCSEVVNDINGELINFWYVLQRDDTFQQFARIMEAVPFSEWEWTRALKISKLSKHFASVEEACNFFIFARQSRQGLCKDFATLSRNRTRRGMNEQVSSWLTAIEGLPEVHARLKRVVILNDDAIKVIQQQDGPNTLFYLDPTYLHEDEDGTPIRVTTSDYAHEMTIEQHIELLETLPPIAGNFMLSGYPSKLYERHRRANGWHRVDIEIDNKASSKKVKETKTECLWMNFKPESTP